MPLVRIRTDVCFIDPRDRLRRFEALECGCPGRSLRRLLPARFRDRPPTTQLDADQMRWLYTWPANPTHAAVEQPTWRRPPAAARRCEHHETRRAWAAELEQDRLVLHTQGDRCRDCGT